MRERQPHQCQADIHHLGGTAARAKIVERKTQHQKKRREKHVARSGDNRTQQRRMQRDQQRRGSGGGCRHTRPAARRKAARGEQRENERGHELRRRRTGGQKPSDERCRHERQRRIGRNDPPDRHLAVGRGAGACPQPQRIVGDQTVAHRDRRKRKQCHEHQGGDRRSGESVRRHACKRGSPGVARLAHGAASALESTGGATCCDRPCSVFSQWNGSRNSCQSAR